jgi:hypothetical protein
MIYSYRGAAGIGGQSPLSLLVGGASALSAPLLPTPVFSGLLWTPDRCPGIAFFARGGSSSPKCSKTKKCGRVEVKLGSIILLY